MQPRSELLDLKQFDLELYTVSTGTFVPIVRVLIGNFELKKNKGGPIKCF